MKSKKYWVMILLFITFYTGNVFAEEKNGLIEENDNIYYYIDGEKQFGFQEIEGKKYFFSRINDHSMRLGTFQIDGNYYHFDRENGMHTGFLEENNNTYYFGLDGKRVSGLQTIEDKIYFFSRINDNPLRLGTFQIDGNYYHFDRENGMYTGFLEENDKTFYFGENGIRVKGLQTIGEDTYFFSRINDNPMRVGIFQIDGDLYYFEENGKQVKGTGWLDINEKRYYQENDRLVTGIQVIDGKYYAFDSKGVYRDKSYTENNAEYSIDENGEWQKLTYKLKKYYNQKDIRWTRIKYGKKYFGTTGCAPTSMAMAFESIQNRTILPTTVADYLYYDTNEYNKKDSGSSGLAIIYATNHFGISRDGIGSVEELRKQLLKGKIVFAAMGDGKFGTNRWNHAIIMAGFKKNGQTYAWDPLIEGNNGWVDINQIWNEKSKDLDDKLGGYYLYALS